MRISIVATYYNRRQQLINTLKTIKRSKQIDNVEMIVVNDCSADAHLIDDLPETYPFLRVINMPKPNTWYMNPCIPFNVGLRAAIGDFVIIQNAECLHMGDIVDDVTTRVNNSNYITYAVYSIPKETTEFIGELDYDDPRIFSMIKSQIIPFSTSSYISEGVPTWYNHSVHRPKAYHFIAAMTKESLDRLGGFDERYYNGIGHDDDEFLYRIKLMGLKVGICDEPFGIHQWHYSENNFFARAGNTVIASHRNRDILEQITKKTLNYKVNNKMY